MLYPLVPRLLDKCLAAAGAGIAVDVRRERYQLLAGLNAMDPASAEVLSGIDSEANLRLHILLIADDQILPESSIEKLRHAAALASEWAVTAAQQYHVDAPDKTAVLLLGQAADMEAHARNPIQLSGKAVPAVIERKWC